MLTNLLSADLVVALTGLATKVIQFLANMIFSIASFVIDLISTPEIGGLVVAITLIYIIYKRRASKKVI